MSPSLEHRQMELGAFLLAFCALCTPAEAAVKCNAVCLDSKDCRTSDQATAPAARSWSIDNCDDTERKVVAGCAEFWYFSKRTPRPAKVCADTGEARVALALKDPDTTCSFLDCLIPRPPKAVPGANPIGSDEESVSSTGAKAGLPYGTILMPDGPIRLSAGGPSGAAAGKLRIVDAGSKREVASPAIAAGIATLDPKVLIEGGAYQYRWEAGPQVLEGTFKTTSRSAWIDVKPPGSAAADPASIARMRWQTVRLMTINGYRWDASQAAREIAGAAR